MSCRYCGKPLQHTFLNLGFSPPSNAYLTEKELDKPEVHYPLKAMVCEQCWLVQTKDYTDARALFTPNYSYFSSTSRGWLEHAKQYVQKIKTRLRLNKNSFVVEIASNDGYLLKNFIEAGIPCLGIEPTISTASVAERQGIQVVRDFFGERLARQLAFDGKNADLIIGNNVYAHVPDIKDFTRGMATLLKPNGVITLEFPHLMRLIEHSQFDTVYHEHFSYFSLYTVCRIFSTLGLRIWNVEELPTHGGSLRIYGCHQDGCFETQDTVKAILDEESKRGLRILNTYLEFQPSADGIKNNLLAFLIKQKLNKKNVAAYGAAAKGNTLLNYAGVKPDLLPFVCDAATAKQGKFMPGSHIPIVPPDRLLVAKLDYLLVLPWNIAEEVKLENAALTDRGTRFVIAVPNLRII